MYPLCNFFAPRRAVYRHIPLLFPWAVTSITESQKNSAVGSYALADASGATAMTRIIRRVGPRAKRLRAADEDGAAKGHVRHFEFAIADPSQVRAVPSLLSRIATFFRFSSLDAALLLLILRHARKKTFVSNNTDKTNIVSDKCHKLSFYFLHV